MEILYTMPMNPSAIRINNLYLKAQRMKVRAPGSKIPKVKKSNKVNIIFQDIKAWIREK
jgi:hypothetical protein